MKRFGRRLVCLLGTCLMALSAVAEGAPPLATATSAEVPSVSARIGADDPREIEAMQDQHNLRLVLAEQGSGAYLADIEVRIHGVAGGAVLAAHSPGPLFFATLPSGQYRIEAEYKGSVLDKAVRVTEGLRQDLYFYWPHE